MMPSDEAFFPPMECEEVLDLLYLFLSDELEEDETKALLEHLSGCAPCRAAMAEHSKLSGVLRAEMPSLYAKFGLS